MEMAKRTKELPKIGGRHFSRVGDRQNVGEFSLEIVSGIFGIEAGLLKEFQEILKKIVGEVVVVDKGFERFETADLLRRVVLPVARPVFNDVSIIPAGYD